MRDSIFPLGANVHLFAIALSSIFGVVDFRAAEAAEIPMQYRGTWSTSKCDLPESESEVGEFPFFIVTAKDFAAHEESRK